MEVPRWLCIGDNNELTYRRWAEKPHILCKFRGQMQSLIWVEKGQWQNLICVKFIFLQETQTKKQLRRWAGKTSCNVRGQIQNLKKRFTGDTKKHQLAKYISFNQVKNDHKLHIWGFSTVPTLYIRGFVFDLWTYINAQRRYVWRILRRYFALVCSTNMEALHGVNANNIPTVWKCLILLIPQSEDDWL